jgi:hypothetical protein
MAITSIGGLATHPKKASNKKLISWKNEEVVLNLLQVCTGSISIKARISESLTVGGVIKIAAITAMQAITILLPLGGVYPITGAIVKSPSI